ncbi:hypothetical protein T265_03170 [Opisthorchis viverrini]|uniref:Uncharacterized protein n=1 Tax=Opisthorchis viverrini TaxID=6198 RepID=A0A074ZSN8_OPIVI|nr:hypothetical protein T265_03170 [Opisthorchis viverrini]KER30438.1 hypothetical protein T265_03170 [Opisthorchis viverrini]
MNAPRDHKCVKLFEVFPTSLHSAYNTSICQYMPERTWRFPINSHQSSYFKCFESINHSTRTPSSQGSSTVSSVEVIPPSSPTPPDNSLFYLYNSSHRCFDPIACVQDSSMRPDQLARTYVLSYLPPFRHTEEVTPRTLRARRLENYFYHYPAGDCISTALTHSHVKPEVEAGSTDFPPSECNLSSRLQCVRTSPPPKDPCSGPVVVPAPLLKSFSSVPSGLNHNFGSDYSPSVIRRRCQSVSGFTELTFRCHQGIRTSKIVASSVDMTQTKVNLLLLDGTKSNKSTPGLETHLSQQTFPSDSTDVSISIPRSSSRCSSTSSAGSSPQRVDAFYDLVPPYIAESDSSSSSTEVPQASSLFRQLTRSLSTCHISVLRQSDVNSSYICSNSSISPTLVLPNPPSGAAESIHSNDFCIYWPPTPSMVCNSTETAEVPVTPLQAKNAKRFVVCKDVVNVLITPYDTLLSLSPTQMSPPTEVIISDSPARTGLPEDFPRTEKIDAFGDRPKCSRPRSLSHSESCTSTTIHSVDLTCGFLVSSSKACCTGNVYGRGDCTEAVAAKPPVPRKIVSSQPSSPVLSQNVAGSNMRSCDIRSTKGFPKITGRSANRTLLTLPIPSCLTDVYASIHAVSIVTSSPGLQHRYSASMDSMPDHYACGSLTSLPRTELFAQPETSTISHVFAVPDVCGLLQSISNYGSPLSPSTHGQKSSLCGTQGRPTDRRLLRILQRYPRSRADMLTETQRLCGVEYGFLALHTSSWIQMMRLTRDIEHCFPHWQLTRQLHRNPDLQSNRSLSLSCV